MPIRILIADDHVLVRSGLRELLRADSGLEVVGEAGDGAETLRLAAELAPDLVLLDITMPGESGIATAARLKEAHPELVVLFAEREIHQSLRRYAGRLSKRRLCRREARREGREGARRGCCA